MRRFFAIFAAMADMATEIVVTVIVPAYNAALWLGRCLDSVVRQSVASWRVIVVDDGSSDSTSSVAARFVAVDNRFTLLRRQHRGVSAARNAALDVASSEWIMLLDADDAIHPRMIESVLNAAAAGKDVDIVIPRQFYGDIPDAFPPLGNAKPQILSAEATLRKLLLRRGVEASMSGTLYRRRLFETPETLRFRDCRYEDLDSGYRVIQRARRVVLLPQTLYYYRRHDSSFMRRLTPQRFDALDVTDRMYDHFRGTSLEKAAADRRFGAHSNILLVMYSYGEINPEIERRCLEVIKSNRFSSLFGKGIRLKNRLGALASYGGHTTLRLLAKLLPQR